MSIQQSIGFANGIHVYIEDIQGMLMILMRQDLLNIFTCASHS